MNALLIALGLIPLIILVVIHEWGHFIAARKSGVEVEEFGVGFPPKAKTLTVKNGTEYTLNWLPLGGFVRLKGEHDADTSKGSFGAASLRQKVLIMVAGVGMNLVTALILFTLVALIGMPSLLPNQFRINSDTKIIREIKNKDVVRASEVISGSPADKAGVQKDDELVSLSGIPLDDASKMTDITSTYAGKKIELVTKRGETQFTNEVTLNESSPYLGVRAESGEEGYEVYRATWSAPIVAIGVTTQFTHATLKGLGQAVSGLGSILAGAFTGNNQARQNGQQEAGGQVGGPLAVMVVMKESAREGTGFVLFICAIISLTLAIMNTLPIPALDGGRLFVTLLFRAFRWPLTKTREDKIHGTGFALLMILFVVITVVDVRRFF
jgi:regulator of sigma E protease